MVKKTFKGDKALLLVEGCKLKKEIKERETKLKEIKDELGILKPGTYTNKVGDILAVSETDKFSDIDPQKLHRYMRDHKMAKRFYSAVKVQLTPLKKLIPESAITRMRVKLDPVFRWTWK